MPRDGAIVFSEAPPGGLGRRVDDMHTSFTSNAGSKINAAYVAATMSVISFDGALRTSRPLKHLQMFPGRESLP